MKKLLFITSILFSPIALLAQSDTYISFPLHLGGCHGVTKETITLIARKHVLEKLFAKEDTVFDNCGYLLTRFDDIIKGGNEIDFHDNGGDDGGDDKIFVKDPGEYIDFYKFEKKKKRTAEICINSNGEISFSVENEGTGGIQISTSGKFSLTTDSDSGVKHTVTFNGKE